MPNDGYEQRCVDAEAAVGLVRSGQVVGIPIGMEPHLLIQALAKRREDLHGVEIFTMGPRSEHPWLAPGWADSFRVVLDMVCGSARSALAERRVDYVPSLISLLWRKAEERQDRRGRLDVAFVVVSPPDKDGYCSFGHWPANQKTYSDRAETVLAEVDERLVRTAGDNAIHVSRVAKFVRRVDHGWFPTLARGRDRNTSQSPQLIARVAEHVASLIQDGDTIQMGPGSVVEPLCGAGIFQGKRDLGVHSAIIHNAYLHAILSEPAFTGNRKTRNPGKIVSGGAFAETEDEFAQIGEGSKFEMYPLERVNDIMHVSEHDNMVAIDQALAIDLTGQIAADGLGMSMVGGAAGQIEFAIGAMLSKGGRFVSVIPSTASIRGETVSRIVATLPGGTPVSIPRYFADYVISEYGIACLQGRSLKERACALIDIAHPDYRSELTAFAESHHMHED